MPPRSNIIEAMFDVQPTNDAGYFDVQRFGNLAEKIDLSPKKSAAPARARFKTLLSSGPEVTLATTPEPLTPTVPEPADLSANDDQSVISPPPMSEETEEKPEKLPEPEVPNIPDDTVSKEALLGELENVFSGPLDLHTELARVGGYVHDIDLRRNMRFTYRPSPVVQSQPIAAASVEAVHAVPVPLKPLPEIELTLNSKGVGRSVLPYKTDLAKIDTQIPVYKYEDLIGRLGTRPERTHIRDFWSRSRPKSNLGTRSRILDFSIKNKLWKNRDRWMSIIALASIAAVGGVLLLSRTGNSLEKNVVQNGKNAVANMMDAKQSLEELKFADAANSFNLAYDDFSKANGTLDKLGASFSWLLKYIPGINKISSANNLTVAGQNVARVGADFSSVLEDLSKIKLDSMLNPGTGPSLHDLFSKLNEVTIVSRERILQTQSLLSNVSASVLPDDKRELFDVFKAKLPELSDKLNESADYSGMLSAMIPETGTKKYLVLFQNNSELRPTGGFPGSYGVMTFNDGRFSGIKLDDIYNPDGQLHNSIIPPLPLQHITPTWGMRDAGWFADFPTSAKKVMEFYHEGSGDSVDGVLTMTPDVIVEMLKITGPIDMPTYGLVLNADNFLDEVQTEVEYNQHKPGDSPKKILMDFFPRFLTKLGTEDQRSLFAIAKIFSDAVKSKHILVYADDSVVENVARDNNFAGAMDVQGRDYLQVVLSNVKGSKTDAVTASSYKLDTVINDYNSVEHELVITRQHNGGDYSLRFYNLQNPDYVRVYVPENAELESIAGNDTPGYQQIIDYTEISKKDPDLAKIESDTQHPQKEVDVYHEFGRKVFGFWLIIDPKQTKTVTVKYKVGDAYQKGDYHLLIQKQPGTDSYPLVANFDLPITRQVSSFSPELQVDGNNLILNSSLDSDREIDIKLK